MSNIFTNIEKEMEEHEVKYYPPKNDIFSEEKYKKQLIPEDLRINVWDKYIGNKYKELCLCCNENEIYFRKKKGESFEAGHIIAESKGGSMTIENLRPICINCNGQMRTRNMIEFQKERYPSAKPIETSIDVSCFNSEIIPNKKLNFKTKCVFFNEYVEILNNINNMKDQCKKLRLENKEFTKIGEELITNIYKETQKIEEKRQKMIEDIRNTINKLGEYQRNLFNKFRGRSNSSLNYELKVNETALEFKKSKKMYSEEELNKLKISGKYSEEELNIKKEMKMYSEEEIKDTNYYISIIYYKEALICKSEYESNESKVEKFENKMWKILNKIVSLYDDIDEYFV